MAPGLDPATLPLVAGDLTLRHPPIASALRRSQLPVGDLLAQRRGGHTEEDRGLGKRHDDGFPMTITRTLPPTRRIWGVIIDSGGVVG